MFVLIGANNRCLDVSPGEVGSQAHLAACDFNRYTQKFLPTPEGQLLSNGRCLEVTDGAPVDLILEKVETERTLDSRVVGVTHGKLFTGGGHLRLAECDDRHLAQKYSFQGPLKGSGENCVTNASADISRNGVRLVVGSCSSPREFNFYFGGVEANF